MFFAIVLLAILKTSLVNSMVSSEGGFAPRLFGVAEDAVDGEFPFMVSLQHKGKHFCGGTLINDKYVLSSARCLCVTLPGLNGAPTLKSTFSTPSATEFDLDNYKYLRIIYGSVNATGNRTNGIRVSKVACHQRFVNHFPFRHDIGLVQLKRTVPQANFKAVVLASKTFSYDTTKDNEATTLGWGEKKVALKKLNVTAYKYLTCRNCYRQLLEFSLHLCAGVNKSGICQGDTGGPLILKKVQVGIASFFQKNCTTSGKKLPNVYTRVSTYVGWIMKYTRDVKLSSDCEAARPSLLSAAVGSIIILLLPLN